MEGNRWSGTGTPTFADGRKWNWKPRNPTSDVPAMKAP
jgi:hypothetical protein